MDGAVPPKRLPPALMGMAFRRLFDRVSVDEQWVASARAQADKGPIVFMLRSLNIVDFLALDHVTRRFGLPPPGFVNDLGMWALTLSGRQRKSTQEAASQLQAALSTPGTSAALFLKRPPGVLALAAGQATGGRGLKEGEALMRALIQVQRAREEPIALVPQVFVWSRRPDTRGTGSLDWVLGPREWPSAARVLGQLLINYGRTTLRGGEPIDLKRFLEDNQGLSEAQIQRRIVYAILRRMERERRGVLGPAEKPPDRVRQEILRSRPFHRQLKKLAPSPQEETVALERADAMLKKMQALPDGAAHRALDVILKRIFQRIYAGLEVDREGLRRLAGLSKEGTVVLLPSHKSHIDYLVVSYAFYGANLPLPLIVAGENLAFFPIGRVFRHAGAFFIRRSFRGDRLYAAVVDAYVRRLVRDGYAIELFLEGTRSRTGKLLEPKFGLLSMLVAASLQQQVRPVYFVPVSIGYERVIETEAFQREILGEEKVKEDAAALLSATEVLRHRYGRVNLQFGRALTLDAIQEELGLDRRGTARDLSPKQVRAVVTRLGNRVMDEINRVTAVTPGSLTALALLAHNRPQLDETVFLETCQRLFNRLVARDARLGPALATSSGTLRTESIREAVQMFVDAGMVTASRGRGTSQRTSYGLVEGKRIELDTSKNMILHFFIERSLVATAMPTDAEESIPVDQLRQRVLELSRLFKREFRFRTDREFNAIFDDTLQGMAIDHELVVEQAGVRVDLHDTWHGVSWVTLYASMIRNFVESYLVCASALSTAPMPSTVKELIRRSLARGKEWHRNGGINRREAVSKPIFNNALLTCQEQRLVRHSGDRLQRTVLAESGKLDELTRTLKDYLTRPSTV